ncbi:hypothetical protein H0251_19040 [Pectobacterium carotovorum]|uniref:hypothetical protein n=1 Tax=Pectobacterium carotovorum TaxID=554 RepID=UPI0015DEE6D6|nr:hypothetical protein [Pectobacterium carotovorum]MBA0181715.1 hypothetical protein [Pectobacterium carotovorum]
MDIEFFLKERTKFINYFYETATAPFTKTMNDIENEVHPYIPAYTEDSEPPFLIEWSNAKYGLETCGHHALSMLSSSLQLYLKAWVSRFDRDYGIKFDVNFKKKGWFNGYCEIFNKAKLNMTECSANLEIIEQILLVRNRVQHPEDLISINISHSENDLIKHSNPYFVQESEIPLTSDQENQSWLFPPTISPTNDKVIEAINNVEILCSWLETQYWLGQKA